MNLEKVIVFIFLLAPIVAQNILSLANGKKPAKTIPKSAPRAQMISLGLSEGMMVFNKHAAFGEMISQNKILLSNE